MPQRLVGLLAVKNQRAPSIMAMSFSAWHFQMFLLTLEALQCSAIMTWSVESICISIFAGLVF